MEKYFTPIVLLLIISAGLKAQGVQDEITKVKAPSSPAAIIIGIQPSTITRPKSWEALEGSVFSNNLSDGGGLNIPNDLAIEFSPYWAKKDLNLDLDKFLKPNIGLSILQNFSFSVATTQNFILKDSIKTNAIGFGMRTMLWQGTKTEDEAFDHYVKAIRLSLPISPIIAKLTRIYFEKEKKDSSQLDRTLFIDYIIAQLRTEILHEFKDLSDAEYMQLENDISAAITISLPNKIDNSSSTARNTTIEELDGELDKITKLDVKVASLTKLRDDRRGFKMELAGALALDFPTNKTDFSVIPKFSVWVLPSFQPFNIDWFEAIGIFKFTQYNLGFYEKYIDAREGENFKNNFDYGARIVFKKSKYSIEFEALSRNSLTIISSVKGSDGIRHTASKNKNDGQFIFNFNYQISENIAISYNFGRQFSPILNYKGNLISLASLNLGIGAPKITDLKK
jgi:hypothetical protein